MAAKGDREGKDDSPVRSQDLPADRCDISGEEDHEDAQSKGDDEGKPEAFCDLGHFKPKVRAFDFLLRCAP